MILQRLTAVGADGSRVMLWFDDGTKMKVSTRVVADRGLYQGMELSEDDLAALLDTAQRASARDRAVRIVSATAISERELKRRLVQRCVDTGYGESRIRQELSQKGIPREYWEEALSELPDMGPAIDRYLEQKLRGRDPDQKELSRVIGGLQRRGHSWEDIRGALGRYRDSLNESLYDE